jgi:hypothetical protein
MILTLSVYPSRTPDLLSWDRMRLDPAIPVNTYHEFPSADFSAAITSLATRSVR